MIDIHFDDRDILKGLNALLKSTSDLTPAMREIAGVLADVPETSFENQASPDKTPWPDLSDITKDRRAKSGNWPGQILRVTGQLASSIQSDYGKTFAVAETITKYARTHQFGAKKGEFGTTEKGAPIPWGDIPPRPFFGLPDDSRDEILTLINRYLAASL